MASANNIERLRKARGWSRPFLAEKMGTSYQQIEKLEKGIRRLAQDWIDKAADAFDVEPVEIIATEAAGRKTAGSNAPAEQDNIGLVDIANIDMAYGLGSTFTDAPVEVDLLKFPKVWVESITTAPPAMLTWTRGRGDSMLPTIDDGDLILLDRGQRRVVEQDALWAFTVGDTGSIKRLRVKGDRFQILSDNPSVPPDEEPIDFVNIVARVVFVGKRK